MDRLTRQRIQVKQEIESECLGSIEQRIDRYLEIDHPRIIGGHHFAPASSECILLYRDGYFIGTVMMSHAINEGIIRFVAERNCINKQKIVDGKQEEKTILELIEELRTNQCITVNCADSSKAIWRGYRNDVHHMNPTVANIQFKELAQKNIKHLSTIEKEIFGGDLNNGVFTPHQPKYYDIINNTTSCFLRISR